MKNLSFTKMHGLGNDFVVIDDLKGTGQPITAEIAKKLCDRRFGVGADQVLWLLPPLEESDCRMEILNADGSTAEMCGNGIRAIALYLQKYGPKKQNLYRIETLAGIKMLQINQGQVTVDMGVPKLGKGFSTDGESLIVQGQEYKFFEVDVGNPHAVFFTEKLADIQLEKLGPAIEFHPRFPKRTNVEFVEVRGDHSIQVRVWERGAGITLACGTGACASAVATLARQKAKAPLDVALPGGWLQIRWKGVGEPVLMEGPATEVFRGEFAL